MKLKNYVLFFIFLCSLSLAQDYKQTFLSIKNTGVEDFLTKHPEYDGRGTIVFIFDTGVDIGIDGLLKTSTGEIKVIDAQDFTGQGDIKYFEAEVDNEDGTSWFINEDKNLKIAGADKLDQKAIDGDYYIGSLSEKLWINSSSGIKDITGNGTEDDNFIFVTFKAGTDENAKWVLYFDTNFNGDLSDEKALTNYKDCLEPLVIKSKDNLPLLTMAINIFPEEQKVNFFFDDGSHGTHCAGIAAGYNIGGDQLNGVAPGAKIIACKLGNNNYSGGATVTESMKKCYLYADKISKERKEPCIINMSFGIGSEIEGQSDMEMFIDELVKNNPYLYICLSNSNEGPGLSSTGMPSTCSSAISSGAVLSKEVGNDAYGTVLQKDVILHFSSRGGAVLKPDICSPGAAVSTVPNHSGGDRFWGTSMASPYTCGVISILMSGIKVEFPDVKVPSLLMYKAIRESASKLEGYDFIDQGGGYINAEKAYELLKKYITSGEVEKFETYTVTAFAPNMPDAKAPALYVRNGLFIKEKDSFSFNIKRNNFVKSSKFYRTMNLKSSSDWLIPAQNKIHLRNEQGASVDVRFDMSKMTTPGLYNSMIKAYRADNSEFPEFDLMATVVIPYQFDASNSYLQAWKNVTVEPAVHQRYFLRIPEGTSDFRMKFDSQANEFTHIRYFLYDNDGRQMFSGVFNANENAETLERYFENPSAGVYELDIVGYFTDKTNSEYDLTVDLNGIQRIGEEKLEKDNSTVQIVNVFDEVKDYNLSAEIDGYLTEHTFHLTGKSNFEYPFVIKKGESGKKFSLFMNKEDFNKVTDFSILIYDENNKIIELGGANYQFSELEISNSFKADETKLKLVLVPAFSHAESEMNVNVKEYTYLEKVENVKVDKSRITLYPTSPQNLKLKFDKPEFSLPANSTFSGKLYFKNTASKNTETEIPLFFNF